MLYGHKDKEGFNTLNADLMFALANLIYGPRDFEIKIKECYIMVLKNFGSSLKIIEV